MRFLIIFGLLSLLNETSSSNACVGVGGVCIRRCGNQLRVRGTGIRCPGRLRCCSNAKGIDQIDRHVATVEQFWVTGYVPTTHSGVTIASGYDIGHGSNIQSCVSQDLWSRLKPYRCCKTKLQLQQKNLLSSKLKVTVNEAISINHCLKNHDVTRVQKYVKNMSKCGKAVVVSLVHWCGLRGATGGDPYNKCESNSRSNQGKKEEYIANCLKKACTDKDLKMALQSLLASQRSRKRRGYRITRLLGELSFLNKCTS